MLTKQRKDAIADSLSEYFGENLVVDITVGAAQEETLVKSGLESIGNRPGPVGCTSLARQQLRFCEARKEYSISRSGSPIRIYADQTKKRCHCG